MLRRAIEAVVVVAIALAGVIALLLFFEGRDASTTAASAPRSGAGRPDATATSSLLRAGNVELRYARPADRNDLVVFAQRKPVPTPARCGDRRRDRPHPRPQAAGIVAIAYKRSLQLASTGDPRLQAFVEAWLGQRR